MFPRWCSHGFCAIHGVVRPVALPRPLAAGAQPFRGDGAQCRVAAHAGLGWKVLSVGVPLDGGGGDGDPGATSSRSLLANIVGLAGSGDAVAGLRELLQSRRTSVEVPWASRLLAPARELFFLTAFPCELHSRALLGFPRGARAVRSLPACRGWGAGIGAVPVWVLPGLRARCVCACARVQFQASLAHLRGHLLSSPSDGIAGVSPRCFRGGFCMAFALDMVLCDLRAAASAGSRCAAFSGDGAQCFSRFASTACRCSRTLPRAGGYFVLAYHTTPSPASPMQFVCEHGRFGWRWPLACPFDEAVRARLISGCSSIHDAYAGGGGDAAGGAAGHRQGKAGLLQQRRDFRALRKAGFGVFDVMTQAC